MEYLPHGDGGQPPGRPGATLGSWEATRGGKSSRWYIFPMEEAGSHPAGPEQPWGAGWPPGERRAGGCTLCGLDPPGLSWSGPGKLGGRQGSGEQAAVLSVAWICPGCPGAALGDWGGRQEVESSRPYSPSNRGGCQRRPVGPAEGIAGAEKEDYSFCTSKPIWGIQKIAYV